MPPLDPSQNATSEAFGINNLGQVGVSDLLKLLGEWGQCLPGMFCRGDVNIDCVVDVTDLLILINAFGPCTAPGTWSVPQSVNDCLSMYADPDLQCKCIEKLCLAGVIPPEECGSNPSCN